MNNSQIQKLEYLLPSVLDSDIEYHYHTENLHLQYQNTQTLSVTIYVKNRNTEEHGVVKISAKVISPDVFPQTLSLLQQPFLNEIKFNRKILPYLEQFRLEQREPEPLDIIPKFYAGRSTLNAPYATSETEIDEHALLLFENLSEFEVRQIEFDAEITRRFLEVLAKFHAATIVMKQAKEWDFTEDILLEYFEEQVMSSLALKPEELDRSFDNLMKMLSHDECLMPVKRNMKDSFYYSISKFLSRKRNSPRHFQRSFTTIIHADLSLSSILVHRNEDKFKIVNFYSYEYASLAKDVLIFLYNCVEMDTISLNFDLFIVHYLNKLNEELSRLNASTFELQNFKAEIQREAVEYTCIHCLMSVNPRLGDKDCTFTDQQRKKASFLVRDFIERGFV